MTGPRDGNGSVSHGLNWSPFWNGSRGSWVMHGSLTVDHFHLGVGNHELSAIISSTFADWTETRMSRIGSPQYSMSC